LLPEDDQCSAATTNSPSVATTPTVQAVLRGVFLVQREVADRVSSGPGTRDYGYLTVALRLFFDAEMLFTVKPGAFRPPPKVDSAVVRFTPHPRAAELGIPNPVDFLRFAGLCFRHKRKTLRNNLAGMYPRERVDALPEASARAEQLSLEQIAAVYARLLG
jgi:16S rRNA (adenine1518-N6/adenine1519-N6)-dimethyltransferase